jgi:hypothetical protein
MTRDNWFSGPSNRIKKEPKAKKITLVVLDPRLFSVRDSKGNPTHEWSLDTLRAAVGKWEQVVVLERRSFKKEMSEQNLLFNFVADKDIPNIKVLVVGDSVLQTTEELKKLVMDAGAKIKHVGNPREITYLNLDSHVSDAENILWIRSWNQTEDAGIEPEKPKSFSDLKDARKVRSYW